MSKKQTQQRSNNRPPAGPAESMFVDPAVAKAAVAEATGVDFEPLPSAVDKPKPTRPMTPPETLAADAAANRLAILKSPSYLLAENDSEFLKRKENRPLRMQL